MSRERQILDTAAALFYEKGFHGVGVDEIGERVGISGPALYRHFSGKDEILATLFNEAMDELISATAVVYDDPHRDLERLIRHHVEFAISHRHLVSVYQREDRSLADVWRKHFERRMRQYASRWEAALERCYPDAPEAHIAAGTQAAIGLIHSVAYWPVKMVKAENDLPDLLCRLVTQGLSSLSAITVTVRKLLRPCGYAEATMRPTITTLAAVLLLAWSAPSSLAWEPRPETYGDTTVANVSVPMDDSVALVGDVMYPTDPATGERAAGRFPVLLTQNPYTCQTTAGNTGPAATFGPGTTGTSYFVRRGYILAAICVRGTGRSGGGFGFFGAREQQDGVALVDWAAHRLEGSNGVVGLSGCSYLGATQLFTAGALAAGTPVKAILPSCWGGETYREAVFSGGMPTQSLNYFRSMGVLMGAAQGPFGLALSNEIALGGERAYLGDWWKARDAAPMTKRIVANGIPALLYSGWNDLFAQGALELYSQFQNAYAGRPVDAPMARGQRATGRYQVIVGPWAHAAGIDPAIALRWFDTWLRSEPTGMAATTTPMHLHQLGSADWINTDRYPMTGRSAPYYLGGDGALTDTVPQTGAGDTIAYTQPGAPDGTLTYTTEPLASGATLAGPISAKLYASSSGTNLNLIATLYDVAPDGSATELTAGSLVGSLRALDGTRSWFDDRGVNIRPYGRYTADEPLVPGSSYALTFRVLPRVAQLAPGHALRLAITTQSPAAECVNVLGTDPCFPTAPQARTLPGTYRIERSPGKPSAVYLPLLPYGCFPPEGGDGPQPADLGAGGPQPGSPCRG